MATSDTSQFEIIQGSTPTIVCTLPETFDLELITNIWLFISQMKSYNNPVLVVDRRIDTITKDVENHTISVTLEQEETLALEADKSAVIQLQLYTEDEKSIPSTAIWFKVVKNYKGKIMTIDN